MMPDPYAAGLDAPASHRFATSSATGQEQPREDSEARWPYVIIGGPWPQRIGLRAVEVTGPNHYPWHKLPKGQVVLRVENDPLNGGNERAWNCVMDLTDLRHIESEGSA